MNDFAELDTYSDDDLWDLVEEPVPPALKARYQDLFRWEAQGELAPDEQDELDALSAEVDARMRRRDVALEILRARGYDVSAYRG